MFSSIRRHTKLGRAIAATLAVTVALGLGLNVTAAARSEGRDPDGPKPTIVLVHGGWADSSGWNQEITNLERRGYPVIAPANPLRSLASDAAYVQSVLRTIDGPIVLVGHSYGGAVISNAAVGVPNVKALVYVAGFAPDKDETLVQIVGMNPGSEIGPATLITRPYPLPGGGEGTDLYLTRAAFQDAFAGDLPRKVTDQMQAAQLGWLRGNPGSGRSERACPVRLHEPRSRCPTAPRPARRVIPMHVVYASMRAHDDQS